MAYSNALGIIVGCARGLLALDQDARRDIERLTSAGYSRLGAALREILDGSRDPAIVESVASPVDQAANEMVLFYINLP